MPTSPRHPPRQRRCAIVTDSRRPADQKPATTLQKRSAPRHQPTRAQQSAEGDSVREDQTCGKANGWNVYIVKCSDGSLYTGITTNLDRRLKEHNTDTASGKAGRGAAYTRSRRPVKLVYSEVLPDRRLASRREFEVKNMSRSAKLQLITARQ